MALKVATKLQSETLTQSVEEPVQPPTKRSRIAEELDAFLGTDISSNSRTAVPERNRRVTPQEIVDAEIKAYRENNNTTNILEDQVLDWWHEQRRNYPCLSKVASALFAQKPGSGVLENDIGGLSDVISRRRGSMKAATAETIMMVKLNARTLRQYDQSDVVELGPKEWQNHLPDRPDYPDGYFDDENNDYIGVRWEREDEAADLRRLAEKDGLLVIDE